MDDNDSKAISSFEFSTAMRSLGYPGDARALFKIIDVDNDGALDMKEVMHIVDEIVYGDVDKEAQELLLSGPTSTLDFGASLSTSSSKSHLPPVLQLKIWKLKLE